MESEGHWLL